MSRYQLILASRSPRRAELLRQAGYSFLVCPADDFLEEKAEQAILASSSAEQKSPDPILLVQELARLKAENVLDKPEIAALPEEPPRLVLACDSIAVCHNVILGKPSDREDAKAMLTLLSGSRHYVHTGIALWPTGSPEPQLAVETSVLVMDTITPKMLQDYLDSGLWQGKAGAFGYQDHNNWLHLEQGSESNIVGLPLERLAELLKQVTVHGDEKT